MKQRQAGFTLIELLIAISLVAAISAGLLTTLQNAMLTMEKTHKRLDENRRALGIQDFIRRQISGAMPVKGLCGSGEGIGLREFFRGDASSLLLVSNESMAEGSRGRASIALYRVRENRDGTVRLEVTERPFQSAASTLPFCNADPAVLREAPAEMQPFVLLDKLAYCRFFYRVLNQDTLFGRETLTLWTRPLLPYSIRIDMEPAANTNTAMPLGSITIPLRVAKEVGTEYYDAF